MVFSFAIINNIAVTLKFINICDSLEKVHEEIKNRLPPSFQFFQLLMYLPTN